MLFIVAGFAYRCCKLPQKEYVLKIEKTVTKRTLIWNLISILITLYQIYNKMKKISFRNRHLIIMFLFVSLTFYSCGNSGSRTNIVTHIPVQLKDEGKWSLLDLKTGTILFESEFKQKPSEVIDGVFITKNDNDKIVYNKIEDEKNFIEIAGPFVEGSHFSEGIAVVCEEDNYPFAIDNKGKELFKFEPQEGVVFQKIGQCFDGLISFKTDRGYHGFVNKSGEIAIKPTFDFVEDFNNGYARAFIHNNDKSQYVVINKKGEVIMELDEPYSGRVYGEKMVFTDKEGEFGIMGIGKKAKKILKASEKYAAISLTNDDVFYESDGEWGMINAEGEILIRAKYQRLSRLSDKTLLGVKRDGSEIYYELINNKGEVIKKEEVDETINLYNGNFLVQDGKNYYILNEEGKNLKDLRFNNISKKGLRNLMQVVRGESHIIESHYFNWGGIKEHLSKIKNGSLVGLTVGMSCTQTVSKIESIRSSSTRGNKDNGDISEGIHHLNGIAVSTNYEKPGAFFLGKGYSDNSKKVREKKTLRQSMAEDGVSLDDPSTAEGIEAPIPDNAPEWSLYQTNISDNINLGRNASIGILVSFDDYIKKAVTDQVTVENEYATYTEEKTVRYEKNEEAKSVSVSLRFNLQNNRVKKLQEMIHDTFSKGFELVNTTNSAETYKDGSGNFWRVNSNAIKLYKPLNTLYSPDY